MKEKNLRNLILIFFIIISLLKINLSYKITGPRCMPLKSKNINSNPYHPSLLSQPGAEVRRGLGTPVYLDLDPIKCPIDHGSNCSFTIKKSLTIETSDSYKISLGKFDSFNLYRENSNQKSNLNKIKKSISNSIEKSITKLSEFTDDKSISDKISDGLRDTFQNSILTSKSETKQDLVENSLTHQKTDSNSITSKLTLNNEASKELLDSTLSILSITNSNSVEKQNIRTETKGQTIEKSIGFDFKFVSINSAKTNKNEKTNIKTNSNEITETNQNSQSKEYVEKNTNKNSKSSTTGNSKSYSINNGETNSKQNSFSQSSTKDNRETDSISKSRDLSNESVLTESKTESNTDENKNSYVINDSIDSSNFKSETNESSNDNGNTSSFIKTNSRSITKVTQTSQNIEFNGIKPGECKIGVCLPLVTSTPIPYVCYDEKDNSKKIISVEYMLINEFDDNNVCVYTLIDCFETFENKLILINGLIENEFNTLYYGKYFNRGENIISMNEKFNLKIENNGNLVLKQFDLIIWQNDMKFFENYKYVRVRINEYGHLIQEVKGLFSETVPNYRNDDWITVWSSQPINHNNITIGTARLNSENAIEYKLILNEDGFLNLVDSIGVVIWSTEENSQHKFGYKFPEVYLVPTNFITPKDNDIHNSIQDNLKYRDDLKSSLFSLDKECNSLNSNEYIQSTNGRFKLILESSGNLIIKDGNRTMWQTSTKYLAYSNEPYQLILNPVGNLMIIDSNNNLLWTSLIANSTNTISPFRLELNDNGNLVIRDKMDVLIWESWPLNDMNYGSTFFTKIKYNFINCGQ